MAKIDSIADLRHISDPAKNRLVVNTTTGKLETRRIDGLLDRIMLMLAELFRYVDSQHIAPKFKELVDQTAQSLGSKDYTEVFEGAASYKILRLITEEYEDLAFELSDATAALNTRLKCKGLDEELLKIKLREAMGSEHQSLQPAIRVAESADWKGLAQLALELGVLHLWNEAIGLEIADLAKTANDLQADIALAAKNTYQPVSEEELVRAKETVYRNDALVKSLSTTDVSTLFPGYKSPKALLQKQSDAAANVLAAYQRNQWLTEFTKRSEVQVDKTKRRIQMLLSAIMWVNEETGSSPV